MDTETIMEKLYNVYCLMLRQVCWQPGGGEGRGGGRQGHHLQPAHPVDGQTGQEDCKGEKISDITISYS